MFLDVKATLEERATLVALVAEISERLSIPFTVGGGVRSAQDGEELLAAGADKVAVNSAALERPELVTELASRLGSQAVVVAIDAEQGRVRSRAGTTDTGRLAAEWAQEAQARGAGEILLTSIDADGTRAGYDLELTAAVSDAVDLPVIASGGAGNAQTCRRCARCRASGVARLDPARGSPAPRVTSRRVARVGGVDPMTLRPAIVQDAATGRVLMLAWMNEEAERLTRETGEGWFWSRSREQLWRKGETSGNTLAVEELRDDCDGDALLMRVTPAGPACHTQSVSCFAPSLWRTISERAAERPAGSYTTELLNAGVGAVARKVGEEAVELTVAALDESDERVIEEAADLVYHLYVLLAARGLDIAAVEDELNARAAH